MPAVWAVLLTQAVTLTNAHAGGAPQRKTVVARRNKREVEDQLSLIARGAAELIGEEELRAKLKLPGNAWTFLALKHQNRAWLKDLKPSVFVEEADYLLGKKVWGLEKTVNGVTHTPTWQQVSH